VVVALASGVKEGVAVWTEMLGWRSCRWRYGLGMKDWVVRACGYVFVADKDTGVQSEVAVGTRVGLV
jgi:hypothetical protein